MARIRTIKPEAFVSESLAEVTVEAERTFFGLLTQSDDRGRHRDNPAVIAGSLWPLRPEHTAVHVEDDLRQLAAAGLICRYTGCDRKRYLHFPTWDQHQRINKPSDSRQPVCRVHEPEAVCGWCRTTTCQSQPTFPEGSGRVPGGFREDSNHPKTDMPARPESGHEDATSGAMASTPVKGAIGDLATESADHSFDHQNSGSPTGTVADVSTLDLGPRNRDLGTSDYVGAHEAPAPVTAQTLVAEWLDGLTKRPPGNVIGQTSKQLKQMLDEGIDPEDIRLGLKRWAYKGAHPSSLPSFVNEAMNANPGKVISLPTNQPLPGTDTRVAGWLNLSTQESS